MPSRRSVILRLLLFSICLGALPADIARADNSVRQTPLVRAVAQCRKAVVNLRGRKTVHDDPTDLHSQLKQVNGMGTGVVIDSRGYILTNYYVVQGVREIEVTTFDRQQFIGRLLAHDPITDLAILKVEPTAPLQTIQVGTSSDLMLAETVAAVGNAYGYEHTVTVGIISQLGRTVQVNDSQIYRNLIQTDAPINPGNSGGPLLNLEGKMIGINVAVRIGAQGIAFAIPVNDAMEVAAKLMDQVVSREIKHGILARTLYIDDRPQVVIDAVEPTSPAARLGLQRGDVIQAINQRRVHRAIEFQCALVETDQRETLHLDIVHQGDSRQVALVPEQETGYRQTVAWKTLGLQLVPVSEAEMMDRHPSYKRGLRIVRVRPGSPADTEGILEGDILVAMHGWKTETLENLEYILRQPDLQNDQDFMFYILRDREPFWGKMRLAERPSIQR